MLDVEGLADPIALLRFDLRQHEHQQVAESVVEDQVRTEGLGQFVDNRQPVQPLKD